MRFRTILLFSLILLSTISNCQEIVGDYLGKKGTIKENLSIRSDFTYDLESQFSDMIHHYSGKWSLNNDTLILNPVILPNDSVLSVSQNFDSKISGILFRIKDSLGYRDRFEKLIVYLDSQEFYIQNDQNGDYIYNENDCRLDSIAFYSPLSKTRYIIDIGDDKNSIVVTTIRALLSNEIYDKKYLVLKKKLKSVDYKGLILNKK